MCSWCWGFAPELSALATDFDLPVEVLLGGLRPGPEAAPLDLRMREYLRATWTRIESISGQPFNPAGLDREGWIYDTELPSTAVVAARRQGPNAAWAMFARVQRAFYAEGSDVTDPAIYPELVRDLDLDTDRFLEHLDDPAVREETWSDFRRARELGLSAFPSLVLNADNGLHLLTQGYATAEQLGPLLESRFGLERRAD